MDLEEARKVVSDYGGFIECALTRLKIIFFTGIPVSLLPYSVDQIKEALGALTVFYHEKGDAKSLEAIRMTAFHLVYFIDDQEAMQKAVERLSSRDWHDTVIEIIKTFRNTPDQKTYILTNLQNAGIESIDLENLDLPTADKMVDIFSTFLKFAHMRLSFVFRDNIPESLLPFRKTHLLQALDVQAKIHGLFGAKESQELFVYAKTLLEEDYVDDEVAVNELIKNLSNKEMRDSIVFDLRELQMN
ncbi:hypothetical protein WDW86_22065 [Bdellovibrionota bacterium FG-2]